MIPSNFNNNNVSSNQGATNGTGSPQFNNREVDEGKGNKRVLSKENINNMALLLQRRPVNCWQQGIPTSQDILDDFKKQAADLLIYDRNTENELYICNAANMLSILAAKGLIDDITSDELNRILHNLFNSYLNFPILNGYLKSMGEAKSNVLTSFDKAGLLNKVTDEALIAHIDQWKDLVNQADAGLVREECIIS